MGGERRRWFERHPVRYAETRRPTSVDEIREGLEELAGIMGETSGPGALQYEQARVLSELLRSSLDIELARMTRSRTDDSGKAGVPRQANHHGAWTGTFEEFKKTATQVLYRARNEASRVRAETISSGRAQLAAKNTLASGPEIVLFERALEQDVLDYGRLASSELLDLVDEAYGPEDVGAVLDWVHAELRRQLLHVRDLHSGELEKLRKKYGLPERGAGRVVVMACERVLRDLDIEIGRRRLRRKRAVAEHANDAEEGSSSRAISLSVGSVQESIGGKIAGWIWTVIIGVVVAVLAGVILFFLGIG